MVATARKVRVHATSAKAYMKLEGIGRLLTDFGVEKPAETGIPAIHDHLTEIARGAGAGYNAQTALDRLDQLRDEIAFFFGAQLQPPTPEVEQARTRLRREHADCCTA